MTQPATPTPFTLTFLMDVLRYVNIDTSLSGGYDKIFRRLYWNILTVLCSNRFGNNTTGKVNFAITKIQ